MGPKRASEMKNSANCRASGTSKQPARHPFPLWGQRAWSGHNERDLRGARLILASQQLSLSPARTTRALVSSGGAHRSSEPSRRRRLARGARGRIIDQVGAELAQWGAKLT